MLRTFGQLQEIRTYYKFVDVDNDRYTVNGEYRQLMLSPRELSVLVPLAALALFMGVASPLFTRKIEPSVSSMILKVEAHRRAVAAAARAAEAPAPVAPAPPAPGEERPR